MDGNHPKNKDPRPKRRKDRDNPYTIFTVGINTDSPHYYVAFTDSHEDRHCEEIDQELFNVLDRFELEDLSIMNEMDNHYEHSELSEESLNARAANPLESLEDTVFTRLQYKQLHIAIDDLPEIQKRRISLYYFNGYTFEQIARMEGCTKRAVKKSVDGAIEKLKNYFEKLSF
ncbi:MAG: sigma-70 family RNA polymerase sigma factor [[Eubacterium] rectale]|nr:sigma-70 family RNA polymerase sigma factor [Agathobacter rectalis]